jgi:hypothetical protein
VIRSIDEDCVQEIPEMKNAYLKTVSLKRWENVADSYQKDAELITV